MNPLSILGLGALTGGLAAAGVVLVLRPSPVVESSSPDESVLALRAIEQRLGAMESAQAERDAAFASLEARVDMRLASAARQVVPVATAGPASADEPAAGLAPPAVAVDSEAAVDALMAQILAANFGDVETAELWKRAIDEGLIDELVARFEARAAADPDNPDAQVELGGAYIQKIQEVGNSPLAGVWATKADGAFDRALELDEDHWGARMSKAVSLSFWPPIFGKQAEAVNQFEVLIDKQKQMPLDPSHEQPYLLLGNLYWQRGDSAKALAIWEEGLGFFPGSKDLSGALANHHD
ncbi:tetratricopeptide repeat protein [Engelhardtia mirabilis]|uniref:Tetratricopeptide repeat protein n=1 Tax=Engelhardtia mirabilis TaxID=2528011 RepID=A0A518BNZ1_9BACT|nr:hypothetical protein Pla133_38010 [Planctomycetes bacterium Pla133]QDV03025.1 hypothetical protein Pla86_38000 [Planctomycetes bacterium Pla86]